MAITGSHLAIALRGLFQNQQVEIVQWFRPTGSAFLTADAVSVGEAFWNDIKTDWRALHNNNSADRTTSVFVSEPGTSGAFGEFSVPALEQQGTRVTTGLGGYMPTFVAAGFRETVATRATRPGQKRIWGLMEGDVGDASEMSATYLALLETFANHLTNAITLGAPVATGVLDAEIVHFEGTPPAITVSQLVTGHLLNPNCTSQVSRKIGRGS